MYRDTDRIYYQAGPCIELEQCCDATYWSDYLEPDGPQQYDGYKTREVYTAYKNHTYHCDSPWCHSEFLEARCLLYVGKEYSPGEITSMLYNDHLNNTWSNKMFSEDNEELQASLQLNSYTGYNSDFDLETPTSSVSFPLILHWCKAFLGCNL